MIQKYCIAIAGTLTGISFTSLLSYYLYKRNKVKKCLTKPKQLKKLPIVHFQNNKK